MQFGMGRVIGPGALLFAGALASPAGADDGVATALVVSVVVSGSVVEQHDKLEMEVIAEALEDPAVLAAITANRGGIYFSLVTSADTARMSVPCRRTVSKADAPAAASLVRVVPRSPGNSTGLGGMETASVVPAVPAQADRVVFDMTAHGLGDFARALRQKFVSEIGGLPIAPDSPTYASR